jgi:ABC-type Mn2+/Zn2+ transport system permease subunit
MLLDKVVEGYIGFIEAWNQASVPVATMLGVEPFVIQFASGVTLMAFFPGIASQVSFLKDDIGGSLQLSSIVGIVTFFNLYYQKFRGVQVETVWGDLVLNVAGSIVSLLALTVVFIYLTVDFKKWELIEEITGKEVV